jgi:hypothetical protein
MDDTTRNLIAAFEQVARKTSPNTQVRQIAVRWLNRLYYELAKWNKEFINFLDTYPGTRINAVQEDYECFQKDFSEHLEMLDEEYYRYRHRRYFYGGSNKFPQNEVCIRLEFLAERIPIDFSWMRDQDPETYEEFIELVGLARSSRFMFVNLTSHLHSDLWRLKNKVSPWNSETQPSKAEIIELFEEYKKQSVEQLDCIRTSAWQVGIKLLSITEYEEALQKEGSLNPNLLVIGEVAMSQDTYNVGQSAATGRYARSDNNTFIQSEQKQTLAEAAAEIQRLLKQLEQTNPNATEIDKVTYVNDETTPSFKRRVVGALQAGGEAAIEEFLDNPYVNVGKAVVKGWIKPE